MGCWSRTEDAATFVVDAAPGEYTVILAAPDYELVAPLAASAVGGKVADLPAIAMQLLPNGILELTILDLTGTNVAARVSRVTATSADGSVAREGALGDSRTAWQVADLPPASYTVAIVAAGFQSLTVPNVSIVRGQRVQQTVALTAVPRRQQPDLCVTVGRLEKLALEKVRLCMVLKATEFTGKFFGEQYVTKAFSQRDLGLLQLDEAVKAGRRAVSNSNRCHGSIPVGFYRRSPPRGTALCARGRAKSLHPGKDGPGTLPQDHGGSLVEDAAF